MCGVKAVEVEWTKGPGGRWEMSEVAGSERVYECELVLLAMGFLGPERYVAGQLGEHSFFSLFTPGSFPRLGNSSRRLTVPFIPI